MKRVLLPFVFAITISSLIAQDNLPALSLNLGTDIMSRYVWRGTDFGRSPGIQPFLSLFYKNRRYF